jgi:hypothetical protein
VNISLVCRVANLISTFVNKVFVSRQCATSSVLQEDGHITGVHTSARSCLVFRKQEELVKLV